MVSSHIKAGVDILVHENIIKYLQLRQCMIPDTVLKHQTGRLVTASKNDLRRIFSSKPPTFNDWLWVPRCQRPQHGSKCGFPASVFRINEGSAA